MHKFPDTFSSSSQGEAKSLLAFHNRMFICQLKIQGSSLHQHPHCRKKDSDPQSAVMVRHLSSRRPMQQPCTQWAIVVLGKKRSLGGFSHPCSNNRAVPGPEQQPLSAAVGWGRGRG